MGDFDQAQDFNRVAVHSASLEAGLASVVNTMSTGVAQTTAYPSANRAYYVPFLVYSVFVARFMAIANGATINGNVDVGIYDDQFNRLVSTGSTVHANASLIQTFDITDTTLYPGLYYLALVSSSVTATIQGAVTAAGGAPILGAGGVLMEALGATTLPDPATPIAVTGVFCPCLSVFSRTVI